MHNNRASSGRASGGIPEDRLLQSTPEERQDVLRFVEQVQSALSEVRKARGETARV